MHLIVVAGFLGSGKTTVLLELARALTRAGVGRLAVVENEVGKVGVDDQVLASEGLAVREIYSGCICCSLRLDLITTLLELEREQAPEVVLLEPSGVASPRQVLAALQGYGGEIDSRQTLVLVDASRFTRIMDLSIPLIRDGIEVADLIVLTKVDLVSSEAVAAVERRIHALRASVPVVRLCAVEAAAMTDFARQLGAEFGRGQGAVAVMGAVAAASPADAPVPVIQAMEWAISKEACASAVAARHLLVETVARLVEGLRRAGCPLIGHVKAVFRSSGGGYLLASATDYEQPPQVKGRVPENVAGGRLTVNAIAYGIDQQSLAILLEGGQG